GEAVELEEHADELVEGAETALGDVLPEEADGAESFHIATPVAAPATGPAAPNGSEATGQGAPAAAPPVEVPMTDAAADGDMSSPRAAPTAPATTTLADAGAVASATLIAGDVSRKPDARAADAAALARLVGQGESGRAAPEAAASRRAPEVIVLGPAGAQNPAGPDAFAGAPAEPSNRAVEMAAPRGDQVAWAAQTTETGLAGLSGPTSAVGTPAGPAPVAAPDLPQRLAALVETLQRQAREGAPPAPLKTEIELAPAALGRIRVTLETGDRGLHLAIVTEQAGTVDVVRRQLDMLHRALVADGVAIDRFELGTTNRHGTGDAGHGPGGQAGAHGSGADGTGRGLHEMSGDGTESATEADVPPPPNADRPNVVPGRLDLRL
ncbi:MAG: flagellar hook-length control protein FliK, partial [Pseudomonadota bacterium]